MYRIVIAFLLTANVYGWQMRELFRPLPRMMAVDMQKVRLGKKLFFDPRLSRDGTVACVSCHVIEAGGDDNRRFSVGIEGKTGDHNAPTVLNAVFNFRQFWDGRAATLEAQALEPIVNPVEMGNTLQAMIETLRGIPEYVEAFGRIYTDGVTAENVADAIAEYERTLITPDSKFDRYLRGEKEALNARQKEGLRLFISKGCVTCHNGINIGGNLFNKFGIYGDVRSEKTGRYRITGRKEDIGVFKVPSLRNVARTAPYMHDGRFEKLEDAVKFMGHTQLGKILEPDEIDAIVAFLKTLDGKLP